MGSLRLSRSLERLRLRGFCALLKGKRSRKPNGLTARCPSDCDVRFCPAGCGSKLARRGYAGFGPCFHLPGFHFGTGLVSRGQLFQLRFDDAPAFLFGPQNVCIVHAEPRESCMIRTDTRNAFRCCTAHPSPVVQKQACGFLSFFVHVETHVET